MRKLIFIVLFVGCTAKPEVGDKDLDISATIPPTEVETVPAEIRTFEYLIMTAGTVIAEHEARVQAKINGIVKRVLVQNNQIVSNATLLAELDNQVQKLQFEKASIALKEKQIIYHDQMIRYNQNGDSLLIKSAGENIRISSGLAIAEINFKEAKIDFENTLIKAPIGGIISDLNIKPENPLSANQLICMIHNPSKMIVECYLLEEDAIKIKKRIKAEVKLVSSDEKIIGAYVEEINPRVNEKENQVRVLLRLKETKNLFPGMHVICTIRLPYDRNIIVPKEAVVIRSGKPVVFTIQENVAKWNYVKIGNENGREIEILDGINIGDTVIITNNLQLAHNAPVSIARY